MLSRISLRTKLTTLVILVVAVGCFMFGSFTYKGLVNQMQQLFGLRAEAAAVVIAEVVDADWIAGLPGRDLQRPDPFKTANREMTSLLQRGYIDRAEVVRFLPSGQVEYLLVSDRAQTGDDPRVGSVITPDPDDIYRETKTGNGGIDLGHTPYTAGWTVIKQQETPVGMVVIYMDATGTQRAFDSVSKAIFITMGIILLLSGLVAFRFASSFEKTAVTDGLMQLYNQRYFKQRLDQEVSRAARHKHHLSLVMLDIDHFKKINDTYGHATGDIVLRLLGRWAKDEIRKTDIAARYGGEEVAIILTDTGLAGAQLFAERLREFVATQTVRDPEEAAVFQITVSIGCAQWERGMSYLDLIRAADTALYHSKNAGRNRVSVYHEDLLPRPEKQNAAKQQRA